MASQNIEALASFVRSFFFDKDQVEEIVTFLPDYTPNNCHHLRFFSKGHVHCVSNVVNCYDTSSNNFERFPFSFALAELVTVTEMSEKWSMSATLLMELHLVAPYSAV